MACIQPVTNCDRFTEGLSAAKGDRIVEIAAVEAIDGRITGREFHSYLDPDRPVSPAAQQVHGLSDSFLRGKPKFHEIADDFVAFVRDAECLMHNASFDTKFIDNELRLSRKAHALSDLAITRCTVRLARTRFPGSSVSLDALIRYAGISTGRAKHSALQDARLLARIFYQLIDERSSPSFERRTTHTMKAHSHPPESVVHLERISNTAPYRVFGIRTYLAWLFDALLPGSFRRNKKDFAHLVYPVLGPLPTNRRDTKPIEQTTAPGPYIYCVIDGRHNLRYVGKNKERSVIQRWIRPGIGGPADYYWTHSTQSGGSVFNIADGI